MHKKGSWQNASCFQLRRGLKLSGVCVCACVCACVCVCVCLCVFMHACTATILPSSELNINGTVLVMVEHFKYLRAWLSHNLSWSKHVEEICKLNVHLVLF